MVCELGAGGTLSGAAFFWFLEVTSWITAEGPELRAYLLYIFAYIVLPVLSFIQCIPSACTGSSKRANKPGSSYGMEAALWWLIIGYLVVCVKGGRDEAAAAGAAWSCGTALAATGAAWASRSNMVQSKRSKVQKACPSLSTDEGGDHDSAWQGERSGVSGAVVSGPCQEQALEAAAAEDAEGTVAGVGCEVMVSGARWFVPSEEAAVPKHPWGVSDGAWGWTVEANEPTTTL